MDFFFYCPFYFLHHRFYTTKFKHAKFLGPTGVEPLTGAINRRYKNETYINRPGPIFVYLVKDQIEIELRPKVATCLKKVKRAFSKKHTY